MYIDFYKYHGAGNDFIIINDFSTTILNQLNTSIIQNMCDRHFGIGADGLILLQKSDKNVDFKMIYYNADGNESTMCGNGGRCIVSFAKKIGIINTQTNFDAIDGEHFAIINENENISLKMKDVDEIKNFNNAYILNTGSPHLVKYITNIDAFNVYSEGRLIRYSEDFKNDGINVNFINNENNILKIRTYERGVEDETLACGTGSVASAIVSRINSQNGKHEVNLLTRGGKLMVSFNKSGSSFTEIFLTGPAKCVFNGKFKIN